MQASASPGRPYRRKELADAAGVNPETLRFYEKVGLIGRPARTQNGYRRYPPTMLRRLAFIQQAKSLGFTLKEIQEMLALRAKPGVTCRTSAFVAERKLAELDAKIASLRQVRRTLGTLLRRCHEAAEGQVCEVWSVVDA